MKSGRLFLILVFVFGPSLYAQEGASVKTGQLSVEDSLLLEQIFSEKDRRASSEKLNERMQTLIRASEKTGDYRLGPGDVVEVSVAAIPELARIEFTLDAQGKISVPYVDEVDLLGFTVRQAESKLVRMFGASLLEDPQVTVRIKEYRSRYYYVIGSVIKPGKYQLTRETDLLDALALAGGLRDKADTRIRVHRFSNKGEPTLPITEAGGDSGIAAAGGFASSATIEVDLNELLSEGAGRTRMAIYSGDVISVEERKNKAYYVLGDIRNPGAFPIPVDECAALSQALGNAGGLLNTAAGEKTKIIRYNKPGELPELIEVDAYALLKGNIKDIELRANDIVVVPGSFSKTMGKSFLSGVSGVLTTLLIIGTR